MKRLFISGAACIVFFTSMIAVNAKKSTPQKSNEQITVGADADYAAEVNYWIDSLYTNMDLNKAGLSRDVFYSACKGYEYMIAQNQLSKQGIITICDFSQCSNKKRLYVLDLNKGKVLFNTYVSHGRNSGDDYATSFSNSNDSHKTCLGFMRTAETYIGDNGYSMKLDGLENGFNDNARLRSIVMHGSDYVNGARVYSGTMMGRSYGCPAVPATEVKKIINCIKDGSCFFNYYPDKNYAQASKIMNADFVWPVAQTLQLASVKLPDSLSRMLSSLDPVN